MKKQYFVNVIFAGLTEANCPFLVGYLKWIELPRESEQSTLFMQVPTLPGLSNKRRSLLLTLT